MRIDFGEHLDETILAEAFEQSCVTFPLIACVFDTTPPLRPRWTPRRDAAREILCVVETQGEKQREEGVQRAFANIPNIEEGPQLRAFLVRDNMKDSLCLIINHMVCDAAGFKQYLREVARLYSRIAEGLDPSPAPFYSRRGIQPLLKGLTLKNWVQALLVGFGPGMRKIRKLQPVGLAFESGPFSLLTTSLSAKDFEHVRLAAKALGFTVNTLFLATLALAWHRVCKVDAFQLPCTMDARCFAPPHAKRGITNLSNTCPCLIRIAPDDMMEDIMAKFTEEMKTYRQKPFSAKQIIGWEIATACVLFRWVVQIYWRRVSHYPLSATNMGIIDEDCVRFGTVSVQSAHLAAAVPSLPSFTVALSTFRDEPTFSTSVEGDEAAKAFIRTLHTAMTEELMAFGARHSTAENLEV
jgi:NRPS condensation-like uncharacterized protein